MLGTSTELIGHPPASPTHASRENYHRDQEDLVSEHSEDDFEYDEMAELSGESRFCPAPSAHYEKIYSIHMEQPGRKGLMTLAHPSLIPFQRCARAKSLVIRLALILPLALTTDHTLPPRPLAHCPCSRSRPFVRLPSLAHRPLGSSIK